MSKAVSTDLQKYFYINWGNKRFLISELYTTGSARDKGMRSVIKNGAVANIYDKTEPGKGRVKFPRFEIYEDTAGKFRFRLCATNGKVIGVGAPVYGSSASCLKGILQFQELLRQTYYEMYTNIGSCISYMGEEWIVVERNYQDNRIVLVSKNVIAGKAFAQANGRRLEEMIISWDSSLVYKWLNSDFWDSAFSKEQQEKIVGSIGLLNLEEYSKYETVLARYIAAPTELARSQGVQEQYNGGSMWWLRSRGKSKTDRAFVREDGSVDEYGCNVLDVLGIRPYVVMKIFEESEVKNGKK